MVRANSFRANCVAGCVMLFCVMGQLSAQQEQPKPTPEQIWQRMNELYDVAQQHSWHSVSKHQLVLTVAESFYQAADKTVPDWLRSEINSLGPDDLQEWLAKCWNDADPTFDARDTATPPIDLLSMRWMRNAYHGAGYATAKAHRVNQQLAENQYVGIGIQVRWDDTTNAAFITEAFPGGAAAIAGAVSGDRIDEVDGQSMKGRNLAQIVDVLRGEKGSQVSMTVQGDNDDPPRTLDMTRRVIPIPSVKGLKQNVDGSWEFTSQSSQHGYLQIQQIVGSTSAELAAAYTQLVDKSATGCILDLRQLTQHGDIHQVNLIAEVLLGPTLLAELNLSDGSTQQYHVHEPAEFEDFPIAVLTPIKNLVPGPTYALLAKLKSRPNTVLIGHNPTSHRFCRGSFDLPSGLGAIVDLNWARVAISEPSVGDRQHDINDDEFIQDQQAFVQAIDPGTNDVLVEAVKWLKERTE